MRKDGNAVLQSDLDLFYQAFFSQDSRVKFIFPIEKNPENLTGRVYYINKNGQELIDDEDQSSGIKVYENDNLNSKGKSHTHCPFCNAKNSLTILGSRAASLTSVLIGQDFASYYNDDKKLIAFSDSVQDAAQRAGFFGARSYQFTLRSAMQQALEAYGGQVAFNDFGEIIAQYWSNKFQNDKQYVSTLIALDMEWLWEYDNLVKTDMLNDAQKLIDPINKRIDWMIYSEYGFKSHIGWTLERSAASAVYIEGMESSVNEILPQIQNEIEIFRDISKEALEKFVLGFLIYMKDSGAIYSEHLEPYIANGGDTYILNNIGSRMIYMPKFGTNFAVPRFLSNGDFKSFDKISGANPYSPFSGNPL